MEFVALALVVLVFIINLSPLWDEEAKEKLRIEKESTERTIQQIHDKTIQLDVEVNASDILLSAFLEAFKWTMIVGCIVAFLSTCSGGSGPSWCGRGAC
jgi:hypothetical protein